MLAAYLIYKIWKAHLFTKIFVVPLVLIMTLSGIIDFFAIKNDGLGELPDYPNNPDIAWIMENTPNILNTITKIAKAADYQLKKRKEKKLLSLPR